MNSLSFIWQYLTKPRTVGAILPSSKYLARKMVAGIDFASARYIVEYGPGTGVFTDKILAKRTQDTVLLLIERNAEFYNMLEEKYAGLPEIIIINGSAEDVGEHLAAHNIPQADFVISGLPFASLPQDVSSRILTETKKHLNPAGKFITFQYTLAKRGFIGRYFSEIHIRREIRNIPPAYVFSCC